MSTQGKTKIRRGEQEWCQIIGKFRESGLSQQAFCDQEGLSKSSFWKWNSKLRGKRMPQSAFVELKPPEAEPVRAAQDWDVELDLGGGAYLRLRRS